jgi:tetratricopeptide (TPR) repeat protein
MDLNIIKSLAKQRLYKEALAKCEQYLNNFPENRSDVLRVRAYVLALSGDYEGALQDRKSIIDMGEGRLRDYYLSGDNALSIGKFEEASKWLKEVLRKGSEQNEIWFDSAAYFLLSYAQMKLGHFDDSLNYLENVISIEPDCSMPLPNVGVWDTHQLKEEIIKCKKRAEF